MIILTLPGIIAYGYLAPISLAILALLAFVTFSYVQVAKANPSGGGSYSVAINNLGEMPALTAAAALFADYTLTVAVSVCAGTAALVSAFPALAENAVSIDLAIYSPYRLVIQPLLNYIIELEHQKKPEDFITILIPEFQTKKLWHRLLHNQTGWVLRTLLILKENVIVTTVPFHLKK